MNALTFVVLGLLVGVLSGLVGVGGGIVLVPVLVYLYGFEQHLAQGTTTALLVPPIGILAAYTYWKHGFVDLRAAAWICAGFLLGSLYGAKIAIALPQDTLRRVFGLLLLGVAARMILAK